MKFKTMDSSKIWEILEDQEDILADEAKIRDSLYKSASCPSCNSRNLILIPKPLKPNEIIPYHYLECKDCKCVHDPRSKIILREGPPTIIKVD